MAHCHIAEHTESGMMFSFDVARRADGAAPNGARSRATAAAATRPRP
jgi:hypothetical protein